MAKAGLVNWIKYVGGFFAAIGFFFRDRVGVAVGSASREVYDYEAGQHANPQVPTWLVVPVLVGVVALVWYVCR